MSILDTLSYVKDGLGLLKHIPDFVRSQPYVTREVYFDVPIFANIDHRVEYGVEFKTIPEPRIHLRAGRLEWDPVVYAHDYFVIRTRHGNWVGFETGQARLGYLVDGDVAPGWLRLVRKVWRPRPRVFCVQ